MDFLRELVARHGWHVLGELAVLVLAAVVTVLWIGALLKGARPPVCGTCGRVLSRAQSRCPRCGTPVESAAG